MLLSFAIPFYNKGNYIYATLKSIKSLCLPRPLNWEIVIVDNFSRLSDSQALSEAIIDLDITEYCRVFRLDATISGHENWLYSLSLCSGAVVNLRMADDPIIDFNISGLLEKFTRGIDFVSTNSLPVCYSDMIIKDPSDSLAKYYLTVSKFKEKYFSTPRHERFEMLFNGPNYFGDINGLYLSRRAVEILREPIKYFNPAFLTWPDLEIWLKVTLLLDGIHFSIDTSYFTSNESDTTAKAAKDLYYKVLAYELPPLVYRLLILHPVFSSFYFDNLSFWKKTLILLKIFKQIVLFSFLRGRK